MSRLEHAEDIASITPLAQTVAVGRLQQQPTAGVIVRKPAACATLS